MKKWLSLPIEKANLYYETLLKLFLGNEKGEEQTILHIEVFEEKNRRRITIFISGRSNFG